MDSVKFKYISRDKYNALPVKDENTLYFIHNEHVFYKGTVSYGQSGKSIVSVTKTATSGLVDTYTILYTDNTTSTFEVTNGADGEDGITPITTITTITGGHNVAFDYGTGDSRNTDFDVLDGTNGTTPHIDSTTGNWFIGDSDTGIHAQGASGQDGQDGITPSIDSTTKHWMIGTSDTGIVAEGVNGINGQDGQDGKSIEFAWDGTQLGVRQQGQSSYQYVDLKGDAGQQGQSGTPGQNGQDGISAYLHVRYYPISLASDNQPTAHTTWQAGDKYIGIGVTTTSTYPGNTSLTWALFVGADGTSINILGSFDSTSSLPSSGQSLGDAYLINGNLWVYTNSSEAGSINGFINCGNIQGPAGTPGTTYTPEIGTVSTLDPDESATVGVTISGTTATFDFGIPSGHNGSNGINGIDGATWKSGTAVSSSTSSVPSGMKVGDYYLNTTTNDVYKCINTTGPTYWSLECNIKGSQGNPGIDGATWYSGSTNPDNNIGKDGDFYIKTDTATQIIYKKLSGTWTSIATITDTKNTAGSINSASKLWLVGVTEKATIAANDNKQSYTNGNCFISSDGYLHSSNKKVLVEGDLDDIINALENMETWPTPVLTVAPISPSEVLSCTTPNIPSSITSYYKAGNTNITSNNSAFATGSSIITRTAISVSSIPTFDPSTAGSKSYTYSSIISEMINKYKDTLDGPTIDATSKSSSASLTTTISITDKRNDTSTKLEVLYNGDSVKSSTASSSSTTMTIATNETLGSLSEGLNTVQLKLTNNSSISRTSATCTVPSVLAYYRSNLGRVNASKYASISSTTVTLSTNSNAPTNPKLGTVFNIYGVRMIYANGDGSRANKYTPDDPYSGGSTGSDAAIYAPLNYYTNSSLTFYIRFGSIVYGNTSTARIYLPKKSTGNCNKTLTLSSVYGMNANNGNYSIGMVVTNIGEKTINGITYKEYRISAGSTAGEGANAYQINITISA